MRLCVPILLLVFAGPALAQAPPPKPIVIFPDEPAPTPLPPGSKIQLPPETIYIVQSNVPCLVLASPQGILGVVADQGPMTIVAKIWPGTVIKTVKLTQPHIYLVQGATDGTAELIVIPVGSTDAKSITRKLIESGTAPQPPPVPPGPTPPGPTPSPAPIPVPPSPAPIPGDGFRVLMVYETSDLSKYPAGQQDIFYGAAVRAYMTSKAVKGPDGKTGEWRILDKDTVGDSKLWQDALARPRKELPWLIISNGKTGFEGPLPKTEAEMLTLLKTYGG